LCSETPLPFIEYSYISPKKDLSFGRDITGFKLTSPVTKTPIQKQGFMTPYHPTDLFEDDMTKAELSNLFSSKSNQIGHL